MICPEQSRSSYRSFRVESRSGPFWRAEARSGKGELLPILLDIASQGLPLARMAANEPAREGDTMQDHS
jgi:hypothetical protein